MKIKGLIYYNAQTKCFFFASIQPHADVAFAYVCVMRSNQMSSSLQLLHKVTQPSVSWCLDF